MTQWKVLVGLFLIQLCTTVFADNALTHNFPHRYTWKFARALLPHRCIKTHKILWLRKHCKVVTIYYIETGVEYSEGFWNDQDCKFGEYKRSKWVDNDIAVKEILSGTFQELVMGKSK